MLNPAPLTSLPDAARPLDVVCSGDNIQMGRAQGERLSARIREGSTSLHRFESLQARKPRCLPFWVFQRLAERKTTEFLEAALGDVPWAQERLRAISQGSKVRYSALCLLNSIEPLLSSLGGCVATPAPQACSAVAVRGRRSSGGEPIIARNFDYPPIVQPYFIMRESRPAGGYRSIDFTSAPLVGTVDGMNEHGLAITYNYAYAIDVSPRPAPPISVRIAEALAECRTVTEAAELVGGRTRAGGGILMLADASGDLGSLELSSTRCHLRRPAGDEDLIFHTNAYASAEMRGVQIADNAVFAAGAPAGLRGRRLHESSERRNARFRQLTDAAEVWGPQELQTLMADHGPDNRPGDFTPCTHGVVWSTTATLQMFPRLRQMRVSFASACTAEYSTYRI
jgi:hypothetical protein